MNYKSSDELTLYFECHGDPTALPVILIHGIGADHQMWKPQIASLPLKGLFLIVPDLRGHGKSDIPENFRISDCADDINRLLDELKIERAHLIGVSMGGMVVQQFTATWPERVISQVIVDSLSGISRPVERFNANLASFLLRFFPARLQAAMIKSSYKKMGHEEVGDYFEECIHEYERALVIDGQTGSQPLFYSRQAFRNACPDPGAGGRWFWQNLRSIWHAQLQKAYRKPNLKFYPAAVILPTCWCRKRLIRQSLHL